MGSAVSHRAPAPGLPGTHTHAPGGSPAHCLPIPAALCGKRSSEYAACPAAWGMPFNTVTARIRTLQGESWLTSHRHRLTFCGKQSGVYAANLAAWGVSFPPAPVRTLSRIRQSRPRTAAQSPAQQKTGHTRGRVLFSMGSEGVMPWQNGSDRNISRYSGGTVRCNVPPDRHAAA